MQHKNGIKDIKDPKKCSNNSKCLRTISKIASKKKTSLTITIKKKSIIKPKQKTNKKKAQTLYPIISKEEITTEQDKARLLVYERHQTFSDSNTKHANNPLVTEGRLSKAVAKPILLTPRL